MTPSIQSLRKVWQQTNMGSDAEFWSITPYEFQFLMGLKIPLSSGTRMSRSALNELIDHFQINAKGNT